MAGVRRIPALRRKALVAASVSAALVVGGLAESSAQDLSAAHEMVLQGDRLLASGRPCLAAERFRAVVGALPGVFQRYAQARRACLAPSSAPVGADPQSANDTGAGK